tara:strand:+ start:1403 stop:2551 length:1149 start_codon:yes stop_codon:yes gene_type:complete
MISTIKRNLFPFIIAISALSVSASAAFYSVSGLSKLFAGAAFAVVLMAGSLEVAKLVIASLLYQYWDNLNKWLRAYLSIAALVLVLITSMGIYGFLSAAYQDTYRNLSVKENKIAFLTQKKDFYESDVKRYDTELNRISENISVLSNAKVTGIQVRDTTSTTGLRNTISTTELRLSQQRITVEEENRKSVQFKREIVADSLQKYQLSILTLENDNEATGELGPLQYLSGLTGVSMDKIINILLLIIIFVFDPLALSLVVAANFAFDQARPNKNLYGEIEEGKPHYTEPVDFFNYIDKDSKIESLEETLDQVLDDIKEKQEEVIEEKETPEEEWKTLNEDDTELKEKTVSRILQKSPTKQRVQYSDGTEGWMKKKDINIKRYL